MAVSLREARPADHAAIVDVMLAAYQEYASQIPLWAPYRQNILATLKPSPTLTINGCRLPLSPQSSDSG